MKKILSALFCFAAVSVFSQVLTPEQINQNTQIRKKVYKDTFLDYPDDITDMDSVQYFQQREYLPYPPIREADVLWSKVIWREIEIGEKINQPLYYPILPIEDRQPLFDIIKESINDSSVIAFEGSYDFDNGQFIKALTIPEANASFGFKVTEILTDPDDPDKQTDSTYIKNFTAEDVIAYRIKEYWYFDKQRSQLMVKIIGINPICKVTKTVGTEEISVRQATVWIYFPELRPVIANKEIYNRKNETVRLTFDDVFIKRYFSSHIVKEDNVYNRTLAEAGYKGFDQLVEADKIKEKIFNFEHDLWDY